MGEDNEKLEAALDRLADMGFASLARDVVEPIEAAMIARARGELSTRSGSKQVFADFWSFARAVAHAFDSPQLASQSAAMFFANAPRHCSEWAKVETIDGRTRLSIPDLKELISAAMAARDGNFGAYSNELIEAMVARQSETADKAMASALKATSEPERKALDALRKDLASGFVWPVSELDERVEAMRLRLSAGQGSPSTELETILGEIGKLGDQRGNHGLSCIYGIKIAAIAARGGNALGFWEEDWNVLVDHILDWSLDAKNESRNASMHQTKGLAESDKLMLSSWGRVLGSAREKLANELALGAAERAMESDSAASAMLVKVLRDFFWGRGSALSIEKNEAFESLASSLCNRLCRDGIAACLPLAAAKELYDGMSTYKPTAPAEWSSANDPETMAWLLSESGASPTGAQWRKLAGLARMGEIGKLSQERWSKAIVEGNWGVGGESNDAERSEAMAAKALAQSLGPSNALGASMREALTRAGIPDGQSLGRLQDLLESLPELGASDPAIWRARDAMSEAMSILEREALEEAAGMALPAGASRRARL